MGQDQTTTVLGLPLHLLSNALAWLTERIQTQAGTHVVTLNSEMAIQAEQNPALARIIHGAELVIPDGAGVVLYLRLRGKIIDRQPGIEIAENLLEQAATQGWSVFFYGGKPAVIQQAADNWQQRCPDLAIVGVQHGYLTDSEQPELLQALRDRQPQIILVGLGVPRQEFWIDQHRSCCPNSVWIGVGGSFDIWAGVKSRAPQWLRDHNLEWTYRLYQEPARWRRMMALPQFAWKALFDR